MTLEGYQELDSDLRESVREFLLEEYRIRKEREYLADFHGKPTRVWNRMSLYHRLLEYPVLLRAKLTELGSATRKLVKAANTTLIRSEEHTSELQSRPHLVCRLLLEKKKKKHTQ